MADEMEGLWVGPMPASDFLQEFLPQCEAPLPAFKPNLFASLGGKTNEMDIQASLIQVLTDNQLIPGYKIINTSNHPDINTRAGRNIKPNPAMYKDTLTLETGVTRFEELELNFKVKTKSGREPFRDPRDNVDCRTHQFTGTTSAARRTLKQLTSYATEWCSLQYRTFAFTIGIFGSYVRFIRWDRSGAVVSERFNYQEHPDYLATFLWRFVHLNPEDRGWDTTIRNASPEETKIAEQKLKKWKGRNTRSPVVFTVKEDGVDREFIGLGSMADARSITGRATRAYPVWDIIGKRLCFLKDTWRDVMLEGEADMIRKLNLEGVHYVPIVICGDDIKEHTTKSPIFVGSVGGSSTYKPWRCLGADAKHLVARVHHRFVVNFIGRPLTSFPSTHVMVQAIVHAYIAHQEACEKCQILHCDISIGNIMLDDEGKGILNDWDLARHVTPSNGIEIDCSRELIGTWQFISAPMLICDRKQHAVQDDIESFVWVILFVMLRHTKHSITPSKLRYIMKVVFDECRLVNGVWEGGLSKHSLCYIPSLSLGSDFHVIDNAPLTCLINQLLHALAKWHQYVLPRVLPYPEDTGTTRTDEGELHKTTPPHQPTCNSEPQSLQLYNHAGVLQLLVQALTTDTWPDSDQAVDNLKDIRVKHSR